MLKNIKVLMLGLIISILSFGVARAQDTDKSSPVNFNKSVNSPTIEPK